jgi:hypothetical protein
MNFSLHLGFRRLSLVLASLCLLVGVSASPLRGQVIDTATAWLNAGSDTYSSPFGEPAFAAWGQTFVTPAGFPSLESFNVWLQADPDSSLGSDNVDFTGEIYEWDTVNLRITGQALYVSPLQEVIHSPTPPPFAEYSFQTGGLALDPAKTYIFFLNARSYFDDDNGAARVGGGFNYDAYAGGSEYNSESTYANLSVTPWESTGIGSDMAFIATFTAVPEPSTFGLLGVAVLAFIAFRRRGIFAPRS